MFEERDISEANDMFEKRCCVFEKRRCVFEKRHCVFEKRCRVFDEKCCVSEKKCSLFKHINIFFHLYSRKMLCI